MKLPLPAMSGAVLSLPRHIALLPAQRREQGWWLRRSEQRPSLTSIFAPLSSYRGARCSYYGLSGHYIAVEQAFVAYLWGEAAAVLRKENRPTTKAAVLRIFNPGTKVPYTTTIAHEVNV